MVATKPDIDEMLPLTPAVFHILLVLVDGPLHGYAIMKEVEAVSDGQVQMGPGTLYGTIKRLLADGFIVETDAPPGEDLDNRPRRFYRLAASGRALLEAEAARLEALVQVARQRQLLEGAT